MGFKYIEIGVVILLCWIIISLSLPFEQKYEHQIKELAKEPLFRTILGFSVIGVSLFSLPIATLLFLITFFLIADVHLITSLKL